MANEVLKRAVVVVVLSVVALVSRTRAQDEGAKERRSEFMRERLEEFQIAPPDGAPLPHTEKAVLRFSNPVRDSSSDGTMYLWLDEGVPAVVGTLWIRANGDFGYDFASLHGGRLECARKGTMIWTPKSGAHVRKVLPKAPEASDSPRLRLAQMRRVARRFQGHIGLWPKEGTDELRLLTQPVYRFASKVRGIVDGAVFAFAQANDPEMLLVLEIVEGAGGSGRAWRYTLARTTSVKVSAELDGATVWSVKGYGYLRHSKTDAYVEGMDKRAFKSRERKTESR